MNRRIAAVVFMSASGPERHAGAPRPLHQRNRTVRARGAAIRRQAGRRTVWAAINRRADRSPTHARLHQTGRETGTGDFCGDLGARQAARCARQSCRMHTGTLGRQGHVQSAVTDWRVAGEDYGSLEQHSGKNPKRQIKGAGGLRVHRCGYNEPSYHGPFCKEALHSSRSAVNTACLVSRPRAGWKNRQVN